MSKSSKKYYIALNKKSKETCKKLQKVLNEYNEETGQHIDFHTFFVKVLNYTEDDFISFTKYMKRRKDRAERKRRRQEENKGIYIKKSITLGIGDVEHPEYNKYFNIFCDYGTYLSDSSITEKKSLVNYLIRTFHYSSEEALVDARKIQNILFTKKRNNINNKLITKEINNQETRIIGVV